MALAHTKNLAVWVFVSLTIAACSNGSGGGPRGPAVGAGRPGADQARTGDPTKEAENKEKPNQPTNPFVAPAATVTGTLTGGGSEFGAVIGGTTGGGGSTGALGLVQGGVNTNGNVNVLERQTGGVANAANVPYSDSSRDLMIEYLKNEFANLQPEAGSSISSEKLRVDSEDLAASVTNILAYTGTNRQTAVIIEKKATNSQQVVQYKFSGVLNAQQTNVLRMDLTNGKPEAFAGNMYLRVTCFDRNINSCQHMVLALEQRDERGQLCKRAFAIHRFGDAHMRVEQRALYAIANTNNEAFREFVTYLKNTIDYRVAVLGGRAPTGRMPMAHSFGFRSWSVIRGAAGFDLYLKSALSSDRTGPTGRYRDVFVVQGPLVAPGGAAPLVGIEHVPVNIFGYTEDTSLPDIPYMGEVSNGGGRYASMVNEGYLVFNDGKGRLSIRLQFGGGEYLIMSIFEMRAVTMTVQEFARRFGAPVQVGAAPPARERQEREAQGGRGQRDGDPAFNYPCQAEEFERYQTEYDRLAGANGTANRTQRRALEAAFRARCCVGYDESLPQWQVEPFNKCSTSK